MKQVRFFSINELGKSNYLGRVVLKDGKIKYDTLPDGLKNELRNGNVHVNAFFLKMAYHF